MSKTKHTKYSEVRKKLSFDTLKEFTDHQAQITHFWQSGKAIGYAEDPASGYGNTTSNGVDNQFCFPLEYDVPFPPVKKPKFTFIDLFAGIGGFRIALQNQGGKCVFSSEIDSNARKTYESNFGEIPFGDIKKFTAPEISDESISNTIPDHDILAAGFPCQPFSLAGVSARNYLGKNHGFNDLIQGNLFFDIIRIAQIKKPKVLFLENVKNLRSHDKGRTFDTIKQLITGLGYTFNYKIINAQTEVPQRRERTYIVCFSEKITFEFPAFKGEPQVLSSILESEVDGSYTISDKLWKGHQERSKRNKARGTGFTVKEADLYKPANTLVARYYKDGKECLIPQLEKNPRKLTPRECARLQGFPEKFILPKSNSTAYKQFGNSIALPVVEKISVEIIKNLKLNGNI